MIEGQTIVETIGRILKINRYQERGSEFDNRNRSYDRTGSGRTNRSRSPLDSTYSKYREASRFKGGRKTSHTYRRDDLDKHESTRYPSRTDTYFGTGQRESTAKKRAEKTGNLNSRDRKINAAVKIVLRKVVLSLWIAPRLADGMILLIRRDKTLGGKERREKW